MLKILVKKQLMEQYAGLFYDPRKKTARSRMASAGLLVLALLLGAGAFGFLITQMALALCGPLTMAGLGWLYFTIMGLAALLMGVLGGAFAAFTHIYKSKDNDALLSMPIPVKDILLSRIISVYYTIGLMTLLAMAPTLIVYWVNTVFRAGKLLMGIVFALSLSLLALVLGCLLGFLVARISTKMKNKSIITVLISLILMGVYFFAYYRFHVFMDTLMYNPEAFRRLEQVPGLKILGQAGEGQGLPLLAIAAFSLLLFAFTIFLLARSFQRIISAADNMSRVRDKGGIGRQKPPFRALLGREFGHFVSSPGYMLNGAMGSVFLILLAGAAWLKGPELLELMKSEGDGEALGRFLSDGMLVFLAAQSISFLTGQNNLASPSVSLEGKHLWIVKSLPVEAWSVLKAKLGLHLLVTGIPALLASIGVGIVFQQKALSFLLLLLYPQLHILLMASFGLMIGLMKPNLNWTNEMVPVKQSMATILSMCGSIVYVVVIVVLFFLFGEKLGGLPYLGLVCLLTALLAGLILLWLRGRGCKRLRDLS